MELIKFSHRCLFILILLLTNMPCLATEKADTNQFLAGIDIGSGSLKTFADVDQSDTTLYLGFRVGYRLNPAYSVGFEVSGWTLESGNFWDPSKGEGISQAFVTTQFYPNTSSDFFVKLGGGYVSHWNNQPGKSARKSGWGVNLGVGYDIRLENNWVVTPFVILGRANTEDEDHNSVALGVGLSSQF